MTKQEVHEAFCKSSDQEKMRLATACAINGITVESVEEMLANVITGLQVSIEPVLKEYKYLNGGVSGGRAGKEFSEACKDLNKTMSKRGGGE